MKKVLWWTVTIIMILFSTGCWDQSELNEIAIAMALGFDIVEEKIEITIQVVHPDEAKEPTYYTPVTAYSETSESVFEAFRKMTTEAPRKIYLQHFRTMVISEELAREGIIEILDMLIRDHEFRSDFFIVVAREGNKAKDILEVMTPFEKVPANEMYSALKTSGAAWAPTVTILLDELLTDLLTEGKEPVLTGITITNGNNEEGKSTKNVEQISPNSLLKVANIGVFKGDKLVGWLNEEESKGYNYIVGNIKSTVGRIDCPEGGELVIEIKSSSSEIVPQLKNGKPEIELKMKIDAYIGEVICSVDLIDPDVIKELEKNLEEEMKEVVQSTIQIVQEKYESDILGFGSAFRKKFPKEWQQLKENWDEEFVRLPVTYSIKGSIEKTGTIDQSFYKKFKEMEAD